MIVLSPFFHIYTFQATDPTASPTNSSPGQCFATRTELKTAVDDYVIQDCPANNNCTVAVTYGFPMNSWCTGDVTRMNQLFINMNTFNEDISGWNVSSVTNMYRIFYNAESFNSDLSSWDTSNLLGMNEMFYNANAFESDLSGKCMLFEFIRVS